METKLALVILFGCPCSFAMTGNTQNYELFKNITNGYNRDVLPNNQSMNVEIKFHLYALRDFDEISHNFAVSGYFTVTWCDPLLTWQPEYHDGIKTINIPARAIWNPDLTILNFSTEPQQLSDEFVRLDLFHNGFVKWFPGRTYSTACDDIDTTAYPFDVQECRVRVGSWTYNSPQFNLTHMSENVTRTDSGGNGNWDIFNTTVETTRHCIESAEFVQVQFVFYLRRRPFPFIMNTLIPIVVLMFLNVLVFKVPVASGERLSYAITVLLSFAVFFNTAINSASQNAEKTSFLSIYLTIVSSLSSLIVLLTTLNLNIYHRDDEFPKYLVRLVRTGDLSKGEDYSCMWRALSRRLDSVFFWTIVVAIVSSNIAFSVTYWVTMNELMNRLFG